MNSTNARTTAFELPAGATRLMLLAGAAFVVYRMLAGIASFLWTAVGFALMFYFVGGFERFF